MSLGSGRKKTPHPFSSSPRTYANCALLEGGSTSQPRSTSLDSVPMVYNIDSPGHVISEDGLLADLDGVSERWHKVPRRTARKAGTLSVLRLGIQAMGSTSVGPIGGAQYRCRDREDGTSRLY
jgi:hypothetical protein